MICSDGFPAEIEISVSYYLARFINCDCQSSFSDIIYDECEIGFTFKVENFTL